jgi:hypothetical protein
MAKTTIGKFRANNGREYNIFAYRGYKHRRKYVFIGNGSFGTFFKFSLVNNNIWINPNPRDNIGRFRKEKRVPFPQLSYPFSETDIERMIYMLLKPAGIIFIDIKEKMKSRKYFINKYVLDSI